MVLINIPIEIPVFIIYYGIMLGGPVNTNFILYRTCYVILNYTKEECSKLGSANMDNDTKALEEEVQPHANIIIMTISIISQIVPVLTVLFIGAWSDKNGRKAILMFSLSGSVLVYITKYVISLFPLLSPWYLIIECLPAILSGGFSTFMMISLCYITDVTTTENRGIRMAIFECTIGASILLGNLSSSYIFNLINYSGVYLLCCSCMVIGWISSFLFVKETIANVGDIQGNPKIFSTHYIKDLLHASFKQREKYNRGILMLCIFTLMFFILSINNGDLMLQYFFLKFGWTLEKYTIYQSIHSLIWIFGAFIGVYILHKWLKVSETKLIVFGFMSLVLSNVILAVAQYDWQIYTAAVIKCLSGVISPMMRSLISKIVSTEEIGKVFAFTVALEAFAMLLSGPMFTLVYNHTINYFPGAFNLVAAGILTIDLVFSIFIMFLSRVEHQNMPYNNLNEIG